MINKTKYVDREVNNDGTLLFNIIIKDPNQQKGESIKITVYCTRLVLGNEFPESFNLDVLFDKNSLIQ